MKRAKKMSIERNRISVIKVEPTNEKKNTEN